MSRWIPLEPSSGRNIAVEYRGSMPHYPWEEMEPGDSFFVSSTTRYAAGMLAGHLSNLVSAYRKKSVERRRKKFSMRIVLENGVHGVRVWRVENANRVPDVA